MENIKKEQEVGIFKPLYVLDHTPINAYFSKNSDDFVVREIPLYEFSGNGEHLILNIGKKDLTTYEALRILSEISGAKMRDFGYAGLKDKEGFTTQFISMPRKFEENLKNFSHEKLKILNTTTHNNKLRIGHLKGNAFFLRLKKVDSVNAFKIQEAFLNIDKIGFANYFGYQRFGKFGDNAKQGEDILKNKLKIKNPKIKDFLISAYQSELFNKWLSKRVEISKFIRDFSPKEIKEIYKFSDLDIKKLKNQDSFFKILSGDVLGHYPFGKLFLCENLEDEINRFKNRDTTVCGLLVGKKSFRSINLAKNLEDEIYKNAYEYENLMSGGRRFAWSYLKNANLKYNPQTAQVNLSFELDKGSYATVILEEILHKNIFD
ncbi:tRNA pseudouridine(13) synthase TruD [Campylobacter sp. FMV-PI01]|uniref:tRNA pseudouridine synthase D n=1 Tax=Campylobacter portucalensis TaxID=2608384 RepID=A0A6L5WIN8_9BACT|nr:tRNA pseudouridine(13) synthase TruD [Campylobacter portucalensis]